MYGFVLKRVSSTKKVTKTCTFFLCLEVAQKNVHAHFVPPKFGVVRCVIYFLLVATSAGSPQLWFLDIFLGQVLSIFFAWYLRQVGGGQGL